MTGGKKPFGKASADRAHAEHPVGPRLRVRLINVKGRQQIRQAVGRGRPGPLSFLNDLAMNRSQLIRNVFTASGDSLKSRMPGQLKRIRGLGEGIEDG